MDMKFAAPAELRGLDGLDWNQNSMVHGITGDAATARAAYAEMTNPGESALKHVPSLQLVGDNSSWKSWKTDAAFGVAWAALGGLELYVTPRNSWLYASAFALAGLHAIKAVGEYNEPS